MASSFDPSVNFFFPFAPVPSTSHGALSSGAGTPSSGATQPYAGTFAGKKLSCMSCRKGKAKCIWIEGTDTCELCLKRGLVCPGSAAPQRKPKSPRTDSPATGASPTGDAAVDWHAIEAFLGQTPTGSPAPGNVHSPTSSANSLGQRTTPSYNSQANRQVATYHRPSFSPYQTAVGRPRVLGPSSSEANLNSFARAKLLKRELVDLYQTMWPLQLAGWNVNSFSEFLDEGGASPASRVMLSLAAASGSRSSAHSEIVGRGGPSIESVDHGLMGQFTPGGFAEWGLRRHGPSIALTQRAIQEAMLLLQRAPSPRNLKVALAGVALMNGLHNDRRVSRPFLVVAIEAWRQVRANAATTEDEHGWLLAQAGTVLLMRDIYFSINVGGKLAFTDQEADDILLAAEDTSGLDCFGIPVVPEDESLVVLEETPIYRSFFMTELALLFSVAHLFGAGDSNFLFGTLAMANLAAFQTLVDQTRAQALERLWALTTVAKERVFVLHEYTGSWRPACMKEHAVVIVNEIIIDLLELDIHIHGRIQLEHAQGRIDLEPASTAAVLSTARERCRRALKFFAQSIQRLMTTRRLHATLSNMFIHLVPTVGWIELALGRYGEWEGPPDPADELSLEDLEWLVRAFRIGSYSHSSLATPLRELEAGLEVLRASLGQSAVDSLALDLGQY